MKAKTVFQRFVPVPLFFVKRGFGVIIRIVTRVSIELTRKTCVNGLIVPMNRLRGASAPRGRSISACQ